jgi:hypothetical protein
MQPEIVVSSKGISAKLLITCIKTGHAMPQYEIKSHQERNK